MQSDTTPPRVAYVLKVYPRFSETFVVSEILAREAQGEDLVIYSLRPPIDPRFHPELARVAAPVSYLDRPSRPSTFWAALGGAARADRPLLDRPLLDRPLLDRPLLDRPLHDRMAACLPDLLAADADDAVQAVRLARRAVADGVTHLHAHFGSIATTVARLVSLLAGIPYSFTAHAKDLFHESVDSDDLAAKLRDASHVVTVSDYNLAFLRTNWPLASERVHRVYNGLELARFPFRTVPLPAATLRVAAVGRMVEKKGFDRLIEAARTLTARGVPLDVTIAGGGELLEALRARVADAGLEGVVSLPGPIPQDGVARLLSHADVFVAPCVVGADGNADGLPTTILEAMATGVPCIATDVTGIPEVVRAGDTGVLCRSGSAEDLVDALADFASGRVDGVRFARNARSLIEERFDSQQQAATLRRLCGDPRVAHGELRLTDELQVDELRVPA